MSIFGTVIFLLTSISIFSDIVRFVKPPGSNRLFYVMDPLALSLSWHYDIDNRIHYDRFDHCQQQASRYHRERISIFIIYYVIPGDRVLGHSPNAFVYAINQPLRKY